MYYWWRVFLRSPGVVFAAAIGILILVLFVMGIPFFAGDVALYPASVARRYEGGALYFPFVIGYLVMALPFFVHEQRRQIDRLLRKAGTPKRMARQFDLVLTRFSRRRSILYFLAGTALTAFYMWSQDLLRIEGLSPAAEWRRSGYILTPLVMWTLVLESFGVIIKSTVLADRFIRRAPPSLLLSRDMFRPYVKLFINSALFIAFAAFGLPVMWLGRTIPVMDIVLFAIVIGSLALILTMPIYRLFSRIEAGTLLLSPRFAREGDSWIDERNNYFDDAVLTRLLGRLMEITRPGEAHAARRAVTVLLVRFWLIMLAPLFIWGFAASVETLLRSAGFQQLF